MGGSSGILTADTKEELRELVKKWYKKGYETWGFFPRIDVTDFKNSEDYKKEECERIHLEGNMEDTVICIKLVDEFKGSFYYKHLKQEYRDKKFACIVSTHG